MEEVVFIPESASCKPTHQHSRLFIRGPIPLWWIQAAACAGGTELGCYLWYKSGLIRSNTVHLRPSEMKGFGLTEKIRRRQVKALDKAGLVKIHPQPGQCHRVSIREDYEAYVRTVGEIRDPPA